MKKVLIIGESPILIDPRVHRQVMGLIEKHEIHILGPDPFPDKRVFFHDLNIKVQDDRSFIAKLKRLPSFLFSKFHYSYFRNPSYNYNVKKLRKLKFDLIINNEVFTLPLAVAIKSANSRLHYDAHEYYYSYHGDQEKNESKNRYINFLLDKYTPKYHTMSTVCDGIADLYQKKLKRKVDVLENLPVNVSLQPSIVKRPFKIIHHGAALRDRMLENMFEVMNFLPVNDFEFHIYLTNTQPDYLSELKSKYNASNIYFHDPVPMTEIVTEINKYDIGICIVPHTNENYKFGLPNKFFEFIQARLMIVVNEGEEMPKIVRKNDLGIVVKSQLPEQIANELKGLSQATIEEHKQKSHANALFYSASKIYAYYNNLIN